MDLIFILSFIHHDIPFVTGYERCGEMKARVWFITGIRSADVSQLSRDVFKTLSHKTETRPRRSEKRLETAVSQFKNTNW